MPDEIRSKTALLDMVCRQRRAFADLIAQVPAARMTQPGVEAHWSVKDIVAHVTAWETQMCRWLAQVVAGETVTQPASDAAVDAMNASFYEAARERPLAEIMEAFAASGARITAAITAVPEADLLSPDRFPWRQGDPLWYMVGGNTFCHYQEHADSIRRWLSSPAAG